MIGHHIIQMLLYSLRLCFALTHLPLYSLFYKSRLISHQESVPSISSFSSCPHSDSFLHNHRNKDTIRAEPINKSSLHHRETLRSRPLILSTGLPTKKAAISYGANILAIEYIQTMQTLDKLQAKAFETKSRDLYG